MKEATGRLTAAGLGLLLLSLSPFSQTYATASSPKPGSTCKTLGARQKVGNISYLCVKSGKKLVWSKTVVAKKPAVPELTPAPSSSPTVTSPAKATPTATPISSQVTWMWLENQGKWVVNGTPPACVFPIIPHALLLDFTKPISILQPGQIRGGSYKPHGGFRWSVYGTYVADVKISVPFDGTVVQAWQYKSDGTYQFGVNIVNSCGFMLRLGHLLTPSTQFAQILGTIPAAVEGDSRETRIDPPVPVKMGDVIATAVGIPSPALPDSYGTFIDFGLLDLRQPNPNLSANFSSNASLQYSRYSVCWYEDNYLSPEDKALAQKLPLANGDPTSDYCGKKG